MATDVELTGYEIRAIAERVRLQGAIRNRCGRGTCKSGRVEWLASFRERLNKAAKRESKRD